MNISGKKQIVFQSITFCIRSLFISLWFKLDRIVRDRPNIAVTNEFMDSTTWQGGSHISWILRRKIYVCKFLKIRLLTFFLVSFAGQGVLNKNPTVWLIGARPANTWIPPSILWNMPTQPRSVLTSKLCLWINENWYLRV